jgi:hypothetical protein
MDNNIAMLLVPFRTKFDVVLQREGTNIVKLVKMGNGKWLTRGLSDTLRIAEGSASLNFEKR